MFRFIVTIILLSLHMSVLYANPPKNQNPIVGILGKLLESGGQSTPTGAVAEVVSSVAVAVFDRYMQYNDFIKESKEKIANLEQKQESLQSQMTDNQKQIINTLSIMSTQITEISTKIDTNHKEIIEKIDDFEKKNAEQHAKTHKELETLRNQDFKKHELNLDNAVKDLNTFLNLHKDQPMTANDQKKLESLRDAFKPLRGVFVRLHQRKDLEIIVQISLSTIHKLLNEDVESLICLMDLLKLPLQTSVNQALLPKIDTQIEEQQDLIRTNTDTNNSAILLKKQESLKKEYEDLASPEIESSLKISDQHLYEIQEHIRKIIKNKYDKNSDAYQKMLEAQEISQKNAELGAQKYIKNLLDQIK